MDMDVRAKEIKRYMASDVCNKDQQICVLCNFLIELTRKLVEDFIKTEAERLTNLLY